MKVRIIKPTKNQRLNKKKVCAYARTSTEKEKQAESLEAQITTYEKIIKSNSEYEFVGIFADSGVTGTTDNRPEFKRMLVECSKGNIDLIITKSISRLARNTTVMLKTVRELKDIGVEVRFEKENINTLSKDGELMLTVLSSFAEEESRNISQNVKWRYKRMFENGELVINHKRFLGYGKDKNGNLTINKKEAKVVKRIYEEYLQGKGAHKIAKLLNEENIKTVTGAKWHETTVRAILNNEKYMGDVKQQKTYTLSYRDKKKITNKGEKDIYYITDNHEPIIPKKTWNEVQKEMLKRSKANNTNMDKEKYKNRYPLSGMLFCSKCGYPLKRIIRNSKLRCRKVAWCCSNYIRHGKSTCSGTSINQEVIENVEIDRLTIVKEERKDGKKYYSYSSNDSTD